MATRHTLATIAQTQTLTNKTLTSPVLQGDVDGWVGANETWTYSSVDDPTGILTVPTDATTKYSVGMRISFVNGGNTIYGIITAITATTMTFLHEIDPTDSEALHLMANSANTVPQYSTQKAPFGFPMSRTKWRVQTTNTSNEAQATPTASTWYNIGSISLAVPIGEWEYSFFVTLNIREASGISGNSRVALSTANNSDSSNGLRTAYYSNIIGSATAVNIYSSFAKVGDLVLSSKATLYLNAMTSTTTLENINFRGDLTTTVVKAECVYL